MILLNVFVDWSPYLWGLLIFDVYLCKKDWNEQFNKLMLEVSILCGWHVSSQLDSRCTDLELTDFC